MPHLLKIFFFVICGNECGSSGIIVVKKSEKLLMGLKYQNGEFDIKT